jgi:DNA-binding NtrC family response regulator
LRVIHLHVPALRERGPDIRAIGQRFLATSKRPVTLTEEAWRALERYRWPGNVRELQNVIEQLVWRSSTDGVIDVKDLPATITVAGAALLPPRERRRQLADDLYHAIVSGGYSFWEHIHPLFINRDITRHDIRQLVRRGLNVTRGNYRALLQLFRMPAEDYKRFMNFLATHDCRAEFREFRNINQGTEVAVRASLLPLPPLPEARAPQQPSDDNTSSGKLAS